MEKILIIDDNDIVQMVLQKILVKEGYSVDVAVNGKEGLTFIDQEEYDLIITDLMMPYANGFEIISKIRQHPKGRHAPVIIISSVTQEDSVSEGFKLGADDYLKKPITGKELILRVKRLIESRKSAN
ncbi:response regulator [Dinghuibacter silviterrae]|uniref:Two-component system response regulator VicR n=1 Tax=Dinghuibacter silviterrae TaxID=1539049 RepID=A0A4R8DJ52_9BACT|nr:response regulator [Dinghuibacter silviterrae]TDW97548.1 two-component system response regulator VicR [Dinghuibacter silviterrae]